MTAPLQVGVLGLGRLWRRRYRPALLALRGRFRIAAVCDQVKQRAAAQAKQLQCALASGPTELLEKPQVEALLLLDPQWYRLWPLEAACRLGKPVLCCSFLDHDDAHADALLQQIETRRLPLLLAMPPRLAPAVGRLRELLAGPLGPPRVLLGEAGTNRPGAAGGIGGEVALLDLGSDLLGGDPVGIQAIGSEATQSLTMHFSDDRHLSITRFVAPGPRSRLRLHVIAERGRATLTFPSRLHWTDVEGHHSQVPLRARAVGQRILEKFFQVVREGAATEPSLEQTRRLLTLVRAAARSRAQGRSLSFPFAPE